tara:strand:+ start:355 stop:555 length:201 start_codon:yes stop_codon:yes gene_type:complete
MSNNIRIILIIFFGIIALYIFSINSDYNLNKSISACIVAQKQTSESFDLVKAKNFCKEKVKKTTKD